ncbi:MAG: hypothetical protein ACUVXI_17170 [bacterium]
MKKSYLFLVALFIAAVALIVAGCPAPTAPTGDTGIKGKVTLAGFADAPTFLRIYKAADVETAGAFDVTKFQTTIDDTTGKPVPVSGAPKPVITDVPIFGAGGAYEFEIFLDEGDYYLFAFVDALFKNGEFDENEPSVASDKVAVKKGEIKDAGTLAIDMGVTNATGAGTPTNGEPLGEGKILKGTISATNTRDFFAFSGLPTTAAYITVEVGGLEADVDLYIVDGAKAADADTTNTAYGIAGELYGPAANISTNYGTANERCIFLYPTNKPSTEVNAGTPVIKVVAGTPGASTPYYVRWTTGAQ